ncbi:LOW QUALITY PROTEIN: rhodopsin [Mastacembelus armatus]|uniref:LOW QUALITY PROTEIN: rhodopsin n=1 Tax=Mastacembelus armatus TaxID=205130 RepID=UPI000E462FBE|nr:LOW QUALITY PROTEIN: rhodopsin-like [Mastacembelus armatus]
MDADDLIESTIRALMCLAGILGNSLLVIRSLPKQKSGIRTNEVLFINLAVSNLITSYLVDLPDTMADFAGSWFLGEVYCGIFRFCADLSETSSIYTTFFICVFWHQKLVGSLKRGGAPVQMDSLFLVFHLLAGSWTLALVFSIPHFFFVRVKGTNESHLECGEEFPNALARQTYEIFYLTLANALPVAGIVFASVQIVITLLQNQRRIQGHKPTKEMEKDENKSNNDEKSVGAVSDPETSKDVKDAASLTHIYTGVPASSCPNTELSGHSSHNSPIKRATKTESRVGTPPDLPKPSQMPAKPSPSSSSQVRAAKSVVAVASVFLVCWLTHLLLRITTNILTSPIVLEVASYIAASYTCIIPYIFLHGVKKLSCSCKR